MNVVTAQSRVMDIVRREWFAANRIAVAGSGVARNIMRRLDRLNLETCSLADVTKITGRTYRPFACSCCKRGIAVAVRLSGRNFCQPCLQKAAGLLQGREPFEVGGIDDCDVLYSATSRDELATVYLCVDEDPSGLWHAAMCSDDDHEHHTQWESCEEGPFTSPRAAFKANANWIRGWFAERSLPLVWCDKSRPLAQLVTAK